MLLSNCISRFSHSTRFLFLSLTIFGYKLEVKLLKEMREREREREDFKGRLAACDDAISHSLSLSLSFSLFQASKGWQQVLSLFLSLQEGKRRRREKRERERRVSAIESVSEWVNDERGKERKERKERERERKVRKRKTEERLKTSDWLTAEKLLFKGEMAMDTSDQHHSLPSSSSYTSSSHHHSSSHGNSYHHGQSYGHKDKRSSASAAASYVLNKQTTAATTSKKSSSVASSSSAINSISSSKMCRSTSINGGPVITYGLRHESLSNSKNLVTSDGTSKSSSKSLIFVKLTDSSLKAIEEYIKVSTSTTQDVFANGSMIMNWRQGHGDDDNGSISWPAMKCSFPDGITWIEGLSRFRKHASLNHWQPLSLALQLVLPF